MVKYYCSRCMLLNDDSSSCVKCGNIDLKHLTISVQYQKEKKVEKE